MKLRKVLSLFVALVMMFEVLPLSSLATEIADATENVEVAAEAVEEKTEEVEEVTVLELGTCGADVTWVLTSDGTLTISGTGDMTDYSTSEEVPWYGDEYSVTSVAIKPGVTSVGDYAFSYCVDLLSVTIPDGVTSIGEEAFLNCGLTNIDIPDSVTSIGKYAFSYCDNLSSVTIPDNVTSIGESAFLSCHSLISIDIPDSVTSISSNTFHWCTGLTSVTIGNSVVSIGSYAFYGCTGLTSIIIPNSVTSIGICAFQDCTSLTSVTIPDSVTSIGSYTFQDCTSLTSITIPDNVISIDNYAFGDCTSLASVTIPSSVTSVGICAFSACTTLSDVYYVGTEEEWNEIEIDSYNECLLNATIHYDYVVEVEYAITIDKATNGTVTSDVETAAAGEIVTLTVIPGEGYEISSVTVTDANGNEVTVADDYTFTMPENDVTVTAVFAEIEEEEDTAIWTVTKDDWTSETLALDFEFAPSSYCDGVDEIVSGDNITITATLESDGAYIGSIGVATIIETGGTGWASAGEVKTTSSPDVWTFTADNATDYAQIQIWCMGDDCTYISVTDISVTVNEVEPTEPTTYAVILGTTENGTVSADAETAEAGNTVTLTITPAVGYTVSSVTVTDANGNEVAVASDYTFTMPESDVAVTVIFESDDDESPVAVINPAYLIAGTGVDFQFSGTSSTDNVGVATYYWDFGDGSTSSDSAPLYAYSAAGTYTVSLTVADASGNSDTVQTEIQVVDVDEDSDYAIVEFNVVDSSTTGIVSGAIMQVGQVIDDDGNCEVVTQLESDSSGYAVTALEKGTYNISVSANGYMPKTVVICVEGSGEYTIAISTTSLVVGEITSTEMTYDEIVDAGIDVDSEDNQQVWKYEATFSFTVGIETFDVGTTLGYSNSEGYSNTDGGWHDYSSSDGTTYTFGIFPMAIEGFCLVVYGEAHWLKEMYNVELIVMNESQVETIEDCIATLNLPEGMSLATMVSEQQSLTVEFGTIGTNEKRTATWYLCGDEEGEYYLSADVTGTWVAGNVSSAFSESFTTSESVKVYAGTALHLYIEADDVAIRGESYKVTLRLENVSDKSLYNISFGITNIEEYKATLFNYNGVTWNEKAEDITEADFDNNMMKTMEEIAPGGYVEITIEVTCWFNSSAEIAEVALDTVFKTLFPFGGSVMAALVNVAYYLQDVQVATLDGSTTSIPYSISINETDKDNPFDIVIKNIANEVLEKAFGINTGSTLGAAIIKVIGKEIDADAMLITGAKAILSLAQGETDYTFEISMDDGLQEDDSISNEYLTITVGDAVDAIWDTLNGTKVSLKAGDISIQAKGPGSTSFKIAVKDSYGELERELTFNVTTDDTVLKNKVTLSPDEIKGSFRLDENSLDVTVDIREICETIIEQLTTELGVYESNPFASFDSEVLIDVSGTTSDNNFDYTINTDIGIIDNTYSSMSLMK